MKATTIELNDNTKLFKELPCNIEAEKAVLGAILNNNENIHKVIDFLLEEHFYVPLHKKIFDTILRFIERGMIATPITLKTYINNSDVLEKSNIESFDYLLNLSSNATSIVNLIPFAKQIYETALRRNLILIGEETIAESYEGNIKCPAQELIEKTEQKLFNLALQGASESNFENISNTLTETITRIDIARKKGIKVNGTTTGFIDLDKILGGMQNSDLLILASRPSMGKTSLAVNIALNASTYFMKNSEEDEKQKSVGILSLEMSSEQLANRLLSIKTGINSSKIRTANLSQEDFNTLLKETKTLSKIPVFIDDTPALSISSVRIRARRMKRQHSLGLLIIDYLQLLRSTGNENRVQEIGEISQGLKAIAKELDIPVIALSQLSRAVELRDDKRPQLSDLRESGNIEQDADVVMFIYREEYYLTRRQPPVGGEKYAQWQSQMDEVKNIAEIIIAKQRNGPVGNTSLRFDSETTSFGNLEERSLTTII